MLATLLFWVSVYDGGHRRNDHWLASRATVGSGDGLRFDLHLGLRLGLRGGLHDGLRLCLRDASLYSRAT
jgi:hypothetical protein